ncbi:hypothetical protein PJP13_29730, partial [Mycobacterium kansasii]
MSPTGYFVLKDDGCRHATKMKKAIAKKEVLTSKFAHFPTLFVFSFLVEWDEYTISWVFWKSGEMN